MKKNIYYFILFSILCLFSSSTYAVNELSDISTTTYRESIQYLFDHGVVQGYPNGTFGPDREINRAEIMKIIIKASSDADLGSGQNCFPDVSQNDWFSPYVCYAKEHAIVKGYTDGTFKPNQNVAVAEGLKMGMETFMIDVGQVQQGDIWYQPYLDFVHNNTIFSKYSINPTRNMTRGEMSYLVYQLMLNKEGIKPFTNVRVVGSSGCGTPQPSTPPTSSLVNGLLRNYITVIGNNYSPNTPMKLIFAFHGRTNPNTMVRSYYDIEKVYQGNAIIVYPSGLPEEGPSRNRSNPGDKASQLRDFALFDQLLKEFSVNYCINQDQVFVAGHSLGAWFTNSLSCARGNVIRAIGSVGGGTTINPCNGPVAAMIMQNPEDNLSPYSAGVTARDQLLKQNRCGPETTPVGPAGLNCVEYTNCLKDAPVIWCPYTTSIDAHGGYYPHMRPDFAGQEIWNFFDAQT